MEYWEKLKQPKIYTTYSAENFYKLILEKGQKYLEDCGNTNAKFELNVDEQRIYKLLSLYFTDDKAFEKNGLSLQKGIMLIGKIGCGKTTCMKLFAQNQKQSFAVIPCRTVEREHTKEGYKAIEKYFHLLRSNPDVTFGQTEIGICFDDLGTEEMSKNYGNVRNVMSEIILSRYENEVRAGFKTHTTTNLYEHEMEANYGSREFSRIRGMFNFIKFPEVADKRK